MTQRNLSEGNDCAAACRARPAHREACDANAQQAASVEFHVPPPLFLSAPPVVPAGAVCLISPILGDARIRATRHEPVMARATTSAIVRKMYCHGVDMTHAHSGFNKPDFTSALTPTPGPSCRLRTLPWSRPRHGTQLGELGADRGLLQRRHHAAVERGQESGRRLDRAPAGGRRAGGAPSNACAADVGETRACRATVRPLRAHRQHAFQLSRPDLLQRGREQGPCRGRSGRPIRSLRPGPSPCTDEVELHALVHLERRMAMWLVVPFPAWPMLTRTRLGLASASTERGCRRSGRRACRTRIIGTVDSRLIGAKLRHQRRLAREVRRDEQER